MTKSYLSDCWLYLIQKIWTGEWSTSWWKWFLFFRIWAYVSSSSVGPCVAGPIDWYDQAQAGGVFSFPWTAEGSRISKCCPHVCSALAFLSPFPCGACFPGLSLQEYTPGIAVFTTAQCNIAFVISFLALFLCLLKGEACLRAGMVHCASLLTYFSSCTKLHHVFGSSSVPNCKLQFNLFPSRNKIKDLYRNYAWPFTKLMLGSSSGCFWDSDSPFEFKPS